MIGFCSVSSSGTWLAWAALRALAVLERAIPSATRRTPVVQPN